MRDDTGRVRRRAAMSAGVRAGGSSSCGGVGSDALHLRLFRRGQPIAMSDMLPLLENFDLRIRNERPYRILNGDGTDPEEAARLVENAVRDHFDNWLANDTKSAGAILDFLILRAEERLRRRQEKETARKGIKPLRAEAGKGELRLFLLGRGGIDDGRRRRLCCRDVRRPCPARCASAQLRPRAEIARPQPQCRPMLPERDTNTKRPS